MYKSIYKSFIRVSVKWVYFREATHNVFQALQLFLFNHILYSKMACLILGLDAFGLDA